MRDTQTASDVEGPREPLRDGPREASSRLVPAPSAAGSDVLSGIGLGLLLGVVVGLATSPVVNLVVGALVSLLAVFLGLEGRGDGKPVFLAKVQVNGLRIGVFGLAAVVGVMFGQWVRITNPMAEPPDKALARWERAFPKNPELAVQLMVYQTLGLQPAALRLQPGGEAMTVAADASAASLRPGLMSGTVKASLCADLDPARFGGKPSNALDAWSDEKGAVAAVAQRIRQLPAEQQMAALQGAHALMCEWGRQPAASAPAAGASQ